MLDVTLPGLKGLGLQTRITANWIGMPIILIRGCGDVVMTVLTVKAGAIDFATTALCGDGLLSTILLAIECSEMALRREEEDSSPPGPLRIAQ